MSQSAFSLSVIRKYSLQVFYTYLTEIFSKFTYKEDVFVLKFRRLAIQNLVSYSESALLSEA